MKKNYKTLSLITIRRLFSFKQNIHWTDLIASTDKTSIHESLNITEMERKRRETVWELFKSECVFLIDHLMVLKHVSQRLYDNMLVLYDEWHCPCT